MTVFRVRLDPFVTTGQNPVTPDEYIARHTPPKEMSAVGVPIIVQDSGLDQDHPWIQEHTASIERVDHTGTGPGDDVGHGTASADMATRYATGGDLVSTAIFGNQGSGGFAAIEESFKWILDNADRLSPGVLNMSWGASQKVPRIDQYVNTIAKKGIIPVAAAGNSGGATGSPATAKRCISVGALQEGGEMMTNFSSWDMDAQPDPGYEGIPEVSAIGKDVVLARASGTNLGRQLSDIKTVMSGTSFSSPFMSGVVADLIRRFGIKTVQPALEAAERGATDIPGTARDGLGRVNWTQTVRILREQEKKDTPPDNSNTVATFTLSDPLQAGNYTVTKRGDDE